MPIKILILNGPNLNMLGTREPEIYGHETLDDIHSAISDEAKTLGVVIDFRQSNSEGNLVDWIQEAVPDIAAIIINAGAYSHTSIAIPDALRAVALPVYEVHLSNIYRREPFRHESYISAIATAVICGLGSDGYLFALNAAAKNCS